MKQYKIRLSDETAVFYEKVARQAGRNVEQVLSDALFKVKRSPAAFRQDFFGFASLSPFTAASQRE